MVISQRSQGMMCAIRIPDPVVIIERCTTVMVDLIVEGAPIESIFTHADGAFEGTVIGRIEYGKLILVSTAHLDTTERAIPFSPSIFGKTRYIIMVDLSSEIFLCLFYTDI